MHARIIHVLRGVRSVRLLSSLHKSLLLLLLLHVHTGMYDDEVCLADIIVPTFLLAYAPQTMLSIIMCHTWYVMRCVQVSAKLSGASALNGTVVSLVFTNACASLASTEGAITPAACSYTLENIMLSYGVSSRCHASLLNCTCSRCICDIYTCVAPMHM